MEERTILWGVIGILFLVVSFFVFQLGVTGNAVKLSSNDGKIDTSGWTENEIMNYEMHGTIPAKAGSGAARSSSNGMVGGC